LADAKGNVFSVASQMKNKYRDTVDDGWETVTEQWLWSRRR